MILGEVILILRIVIEVIYFRRLVNPPPDKEVGTSSTPLPVFTSASCGADEDRLGGDTLHYLPHPAQPLVSPPLSLVRRGVRDYTN